MGLQAHRRTSKNSWQRYHQQDRDLQRTRSRSIPIISPLLNRCQKGAGAYGTRTGNSALNKTTGKTFPVTPLPKSRQAIIDAGGLIPYTRNRLLETATATSA